MPSPRSASSRPRRSRWPWVLLVFVVVVAVVVAVLDRVAVGVADDKVATAVANASSEYDVQPGGVDVDIRGIPFLTQALRGRFGRVNITMRNAKASDVTIRRLDAKLSDVDVPRSVLTGSAPHNVTAQRVTATGMVDPKVLSSVLNNPNLKITQAANGIRVTGPISVAGIGGDVDATLLPKLSGGRLVLQVQSLLIDGANPPSRIRSLAANYLDGGISLPELPFKLQITGVAAKDGMVQITGAARDVTLVN